MSSNPPGADSGQTTPDPNKPTTSVNTQPQLQPATAISATPQKPGATLTANPKKEPEYEEKGRMAKVKMPGKDDDLQAWILARIFELLLSGMQTGVGAGVAAVGMLRHPGGTSALALGALMATPSAVVGGLRNGLKMVGINIPPTPGLDSLGSNLRNYGLNVLKDSPTFNKGLEILKGVPEINEYLNRIAKVQKPQPSTKKDSEKEDKPDLASNTELTSKLQASKLQAVEAELESRKTQVLGDKTDTPQFGAHKEKKAEEARVEMQQKEEAAKRQKAEAAEKQKAGLDANADKQTLKPTKPK